MGRLVARAVEEFGRLDIVVNNAGILVWEPIAEIGEAAFDELMAINLKGAFALTRHACAYWRAASLRGERGQRADHQHGLRRRAVRLPARRPLRRVEGRDGVADDGDGDGDAPPRRDGERDLAGGADADGEGDLPRGAGGPGGVRRLRPGEHLAARRLSGIRRGGVADRPGALHPGRPHPPDVGLDESRASITAPAGGRSRPTSSATRCRCSTARCRRSSRRPRSWTRWSGSTRRSPAGRELRASSWRSSSIP